VTDKIYLEQALTDLKTLLDMARWAVSRFHDADLYFGHGTDNAWDEALVLMGHALHLPAHMLAADNGRLLDARLTRSEKEKIADLVLQRVQTRKPLPYILQQAWFCELPFYVDERVLIPRSPFAELIQSRFSAFLSDEPQHILDLCTGGGCIAIALAYAFDEAAVDAVDISPEALLVAEQNVVSHGLQHRLCLIESDLLSRVKGNQYDLIVCNPPYVDAEDMADLPDEYRYEPELALAAGEDGLDLVAHILADAPDCLTDEGWLFVEVGNSQVHVEQRFPGLDLHWLELLHGGQGIFAVSKSALLAYAQHSS